MPTFTVIGSVTPFLHVNMQRGDKIFAESDAMVSMDTTIDLEGKMRGGLMSSMLNRFANDESFFMQEFVANRGEGDLLLAPVTTGAIELLDVGPSQYLISDGAFLAAEDTVNLVSKTQGIMQALGGGTGGFIVNQAEGHGKLAVAGLGDIFGLDINPGQETIVDNGHIVAWENTLTYNMSMNTAQGQGMFRRLLNSATSGEGLVTRFSGAGKVYICSRNKGSFAGWLASMLPGDSSSSSSSSSTPSLGDFF